MGEVVFMKTHCTIQKGICPRGLTICCMECEYGKSNSCEEDCLNHIAKCKLGSVVDEEEEDDTISLH